MAFVVPSSIKSIQAAADSSAAPADVRRVANCLAVALERLQSNPHQPREQIDEAALCGLVASIRAHGLLQPIVVAKTGDGYQVIAGHRRVEAFKRLRDEAASDSDRKKFSTIEAIERHEVTDAQKAVFALVENLQREDLNPLEAARALEKLQAQQKLKTAKDVADATGVKEDRVRRLLRLCDAPSVVKDAVGKGLLVTVRDAEGNALVNESGKERREHRQLDLMSGLEFARAHKHWLKKSPNKADAKTAALIVRALDEGWHLRRVQEHVADLLEENQEEGRAAPKPGSLFSLGARALSVRVDRLEQASASEKDALAAELRRLLALLEPPKTPQAALPKVPTEASPSVPRPV